MRSSWPDECEIVADREIDKLNIKFARLKRWKFDARTESYVANESSRAHRAASDRFRRSGREATTQRLQAVVLLTVMVPRRIRPEGQLMAEP